MSGSPLRHQQIWHLEPRDPAVLGDGRGSLAFVTGGTWPFPFPGTVAGMVRTRLYESLASTHEDEATRRRADDATSKQLLEDVRIRGPWLLRRRSDEDPGEVWFPAPADARIDSASICERRGEDCSLYPAPADARIDSASSLVGPEIIDLDTSGNEGVHGSRTPGHPELPGLCRLPDRKEESGDKLRELSNTFWPMRFIVRWALGVHAPAEQAGDLRALFTEVQRETKAQLDNPLLVREERIHVAIDDRRGTAEPRQLFATAGFRLRPSWRLVVEVTSEGDLPPAGETWVQLGGRGRRSFLEVHTSEGPGAFPRWDTVHDLYHRHADGRRGLRLQLLSPAYLPARSPSESSVHQHGDPAWCPSWLLPGASGIHPLLADWAERTGLTLRLHAVCIPCHLVVSGWNLRGQPQSAGPSVRHADRTGAPREVRRLVPAGSVYYLTLHDREGNRIGDPKTHLPGLCEALWGAVLDPEGPGELPLPNEFRAPPAADGYGHILPGYWT